MLSEKEESDVAHKQLAKHRMAITDGFSTSRTKLRHENTDI